jgi:RND family efflux transporter MFP subunit
MAAGLWIAAATWVTAAEEPPKPVNVVTAARMAVEKRLELSGSVTARRHARLSARTSGLIRQLKVDAGDVVKTGDVLMELDDELAAIALDRVAVEREQAALELEDARRLNLEAQNLAKTGAFPKSEAESRESAVKVRATELRRGEVMEKEQQALVERHRLVAPFDGVIRAKLAEEGEWVQTGMPVVELVETASLRMDVQAPQELFAVLEKNPSLSVRLDAYPDQPLPGKLAVIVPVKDEVARTFLARIDMEDPQGLAAAGMSGRVMFVFREDDEVLQVPRDAIVRFPDGTAKVWTVSEEGGKTVAKSRVVDLGQALTESIEIVKGIAAGDRVVLRGNESLREGQTVEILPAQPDSTPAAQ